VTLLRSGNTGAALTPPGRPQTSEARAAESPAPRRHSENLLRVGGAAAIGIGLIAAAFALSAQPGPGQGLALSLVFGAAFGFVLQRSRFCFFCNFRDLFDARDPRGMLGILTALAVGIVGYTVVLGAWLPDPTAGRLPPEAFIGPVGPVLVLAGLAFGAGMAISGSCVSAHLYRLGEGSPTAPFALLGTVAGFGVGFMTWNSLYLVSISTTPVIWLPAWLGYSGTMVVALTTLGIIAFALLRLLTSGANSAAQTRNPVRVIFVERWPAWAGGIAVGAIGVASYLRVGPLGVTAELGARARQATDGLGLLPLRLEGLDTLRGCIAVVREAALTPNGLFVGGLVLASLAAALGANQFRPAWPTVSQAVRGLGGGVLLGWGAMTGLGCTVGTLMSGIMAGALSGWVFAIAVFTGVAGTLHVGRRIGVLPL
jgi:uncharacterized membrane protein YedE/YeeE